MFGPGEDFVAKRPQAHRWIRDFYRQQISEGKLPIVIETTGIGDRAFLRELAQHYSLLLVMLTTPRDMCLDRTNARPKGRNVNAPGKPMSEFYDDWHAQTKPTYDLDLSATGTDLELAVVAILAALET
jgi:hypothetical protein